ncbi:Flp pilus assembly protein CpaB [Photobacterium chitinilyticum]|uniref:Flp pilus assembly protein CpaB n=1 Tax=Photobacterium chitinilyticum TaxID=2485123 RepID=A0A3S3S1N7_9GAMM|nr:Flp pilus assembly protein CpaB [Photobacterium chitinilyticum]RWX55796.1 Flp pilus assembly protein CpaB [Photobacterium chitinilyticum]
MKAKRLVYLSVFISLAGFIWLFLSLSEPKQIVAEQQAEIKKLEVLVTSGPVKAGRHYSASLFEWKTVDESEVSNRLDYIDKAIFDTAQLTKTVLAGDYAAGQILSASDFLNPESGGVLSVMLRPGYRAVSVPVDQVTANSGLVGPGDYVDVLLLASKEQELRTRGNETQSLYVKTIAQNVRVLAFNDAVQADRYIEAQKKYKGFIPDNSAVTLEVSPVQANKVILANQLGTLSMVLRSQNNPGTDVVDIKQINIDDIFPDIKQVQPDLGLVEFRAKDKRIMNNAGTQDD